MRDGGKRSWDSVCEDCRRFRTGRCAAARATAGPKDSIAAICEWFAPAGAPDRDRREAAREPLGGAGAPPARAAER